MPIASTHLWATSVQESRRTSLFCLSQVKIPSYLFSSNNGRIACTRLQLQILDNAKNQRLIGVVKRPRSLSPMRALDERSRTLFRSLWGGPGPIV